MFVHRFRLIYQRFLAGVEQSVRSINKGLMREFELSVGQGIRKMRGSFREADAGRAGCDHSMCH